MTLRLSGPTVKVWSAQSRLAKRVALGGTLQPSLDQRRSHVFDRTPASTTVCCCLPPARAWPSPNQRLTVAPTQRSRRSRVHSLLPAAPQCCKPTASTARHRKKDPYAVSFPPASWLSRHLTTKTNALRRRGES